MHFIETEYIGWARPRGTLKAHYFTGQEGAPSLCGRWNADNLPAGAFHDGDHRSQDNCAACRQQRLLRAAHPPVAPRLSPN